MDKKQQNSTNLENIDNTGLTPLQQKAVSLLVCGKSITEVSNELQIDRGTLYNWFDKISFKAYYNKQCNEIKTDTFNGLMGIYADSIKAIKDSINSNNQTLRFKAAIWLIEQLNNIPFDETDPIEMIKKECIVNNWDIEIGTSFDENKYKLLLKENGLKDK